MNIYHEGKTPSQWSQFRETFQKESLHRKKSQNMHGSRSFRQQEVVQAQLTAKGSDNVFFQSSTYYRGGPMVISKKTMISHIPDWVQLFLWRVPIAYSYGNL